MTDRHEELRLRNQICFPIYLCSKEITRKYTALLSELDLTYTQYIVMMFFWERKSSNVKTLGETLMLDPSTLTPILKKLESKGYLTRSRSAEDERNLTVTLTEEGEKLEEAALGLPGKMACCIGLDEEDSKTLCSLIMKILTNIGKGE